jgi:hypothetical protein
MLESARGPVPNLAEAIAGKRIRGSWWADRKRQEIFLLTRAIRDSDDILVCRLIDGRITYVHRRLWPALVRLSKHFNVESLGRLRELHTAEGKHILHIVLYPEWVPLEARLRARDMSESQAILQLGKGYRDGRPRHSRGTG